MASLASKLDNPNFIEGKNRKRGNPNFVAGYKYGFQADNNEADDSPGRLWLTDEERQTIREICPALINHAFDILNAPLSHATADHKIKAIDTILSYAYGTPQIATLVRYEVELICEAYDLPKYTKLVGKDGQKLFGNHGGFKPSQRYKSQWDRQEAIKRIREQQAHEDAPIQDDDAVDPKPEVHIYETEEQQRTLQREQDSGQEQPKPIEPKPIDPKQETKAQESRRAPTTAEMYARWKALSE